jgi:hypothetical protein
MPIVYAHVAGFPLEELLLPLVTSAGALVLAARAWIERARRRRGRD